MTDDFKQLVKDLAEWSSKYPRGFTYTMSQKNMDDELIKLEERAKELVMRDNSIDKTTQP